MASTLCFKRSSLIRVFVDYSHVCLNMMEHQMRQVFGRLSSCCGQERQGLHGPFHVKTCLRAYADSEGPDQGLHCPLTITKTYLYNFDPLKPHFYVVKLGFTGVYISFLSSARKIDYGYSLEPPRRGGSNEYPQSIF